MASLVMVNGAERRERETTVDPNESAEAREESGGGRSEREGQSEAVGLGLVCDAYGSSSDHDE